MHIIYSVMFGLSYGVKENFQVKFERKVGEKAKTISNFVLLCGENWLKA